MPLLYKLWQADVISCAVIAVVWLFAFIRSPAIRRDPEVMWTWPLIPVARDAAILAWLGILVLAPIPLAGHYYPIEAAMPAVLAYYFAHEWLDAEDPEERGVVALVGIMRVLCVLAITWPATFLPVLGLALFVGVGCWLGGLVGTPTEVAATGAPLARDGPGRWRPPVRALLVPQDRARIADLASVGSSPWWSRAGLCASS